MLQDFNYYLTTFHEYGEVTEINYPIVTAAGIPSVKLNEIVMFDTNETGQVISLHENSVKIMLFSRKGIKIGTKLSRTNSQLQVQVGNDLLGRIINPLGQPITNLLTPIHAEETRPIDIPPLGISRRRKITHPLVTGTAVVDIMIPLGKGQKQLVLGDRKTGKSSFVLSAIKSQIKEGAIAIVATIGKRRTDIKALEEFMLSENRQKQMLIVATSAFDSPGLIFLTPFTAMTIAEYFRDQGKDVIIIFDDLLTHAQFYREFALLAQTFPGRDSYPGDIFYVHARLLERAGNFIHEEKGQTSISGLPIVETQDGDLTGYIVSNLMSITDGHLFFDSNVFAQGRRPAINIPLSVTRVGRQTQNTIEKDINRELSSLFAVYEKGENLSHFGSEMTESVKSIFSIAEKVFVMFNQPAGLIMPKEVSLVLFALIWLNILNDAPSIENARRNMVINCENEQNRLLLKSLLNASNFNAFLKNVKDNKELIMPLLNEGTKTDGK